MAKVFHNSSATDKAINALDRKREQERHVMLSQTFKNADELANRLVQRLLDEKILETTSDRDIKENISSLLRKLSDMDDFDIQFKIAPQRGLVNDPNFISLYLTQYIIEDLIDHPKVLDIFGDDLSIYMAVDSIMTRIRPA